jgi:hypothetical protein
MNIGLGYEVQTQRRDLNAFQKRMSKGKNIEGVKLPELRLGTMSLNFDPGVDSLPRGSYDYQVTVIDPSTQKAAFWRAPILLVSQ